MPWSRMDIINLAYSKLNKNAVNAVSNSGAFANSTDRVFDLLYESIIETMSWRFATKIQQLSVLVTAPPVDEWDYQLQLPSDWLATVKTYPRINFNIFEDKMYSNNNDVKLEYRFLPEITHLPASFVHYFALRIAHWFADSVAENEALSEKLAVEMHDQLSAALFIDSQNKPIPAMKNNPMIDARNQYYDWDRPPTE